MLFYLEVVTKASLIIERSTHEEALAHVKRMEREMNRSGHHGEVTIVHLLRFADHVGTCDVCGLGKEPCGVGLRMMESEAGDGSLASVLNEGLGS